jgi:hypothetical protein
MSSDNKNRILQLYKFLDKTLHFKLSKNCKFDVFLHFCEHCILYLSVRHILSDLYILYSSCRKSAIKLNCEKKSDFIEKKGNG